MKDFIETCPYFTFTIIRNTGTDGVFNALNSMDHPIKSTVFPDFDFSKHRLPQHRSGAIKRKLFLFAPSTNPADVVMAGNQEDGMIALSYFLSRYLKTAFYSIALCDNKGAEPKSEFHLIDKGESKRVVYAMKDPRWIFFEEGTPLPFEDLAYYQNRYIKNRLNKAVLSEYFAKLGFDFLHNDFWRSEKAVFIEYL